MKKTIFHIGMLAVAALAFVACNKAPEGDLPKDEAKHLVTVTLGKTIETKTAVVEGATSASYKWDANDKQFLHVYENGTEGTIETFALSENNTVATLTVSFTGNAASQLDYTAKYACNSSKAGNPEIFSTQYPKADNFDPSADILISKATPDVTGLSSRPNTLQFTMGRPVTVNKMTLTGLSSEELVKSVEFELSQQLSGFYNLENGSFTNGVKKLTFDYTKERTFVDNEIVISDRAVAGGVSPDQNGNLPVYFISAPVEAAGIVSVIVTTDKNVYTKNTTCNPNPFNGKSITFAVGTMKRFTMAMGDYGAPISTATVYTLVENESSLSDGATYILVASDADIAMGVYTGGNNHPVVEVVKSADSQNRSIVEIDNTLAVEPIILKRVGNNWTMQNNAEGNTYFNQYLICAGGDNSNHLRETSEESDYKEWTISVNNGVSTIINANSLAVRNRVYYNTQNAGMFACYKEQSSSNYHTVSLYVDLSTAIPNLATPQNLSATVNGSNVIVTWDAVSNADSYTVTLGETNQTGITNNQTTFANVADGTYTITVTAVSNDHSVYGDSSPASTSIKVGLDFTTIAQLNALVSSTATSYSGSLTNAVVSFVPGTKDAIIKDATGSILYHKDGHALLQGQTFSGNLTVTAQIYASTSEITEMDAEFTGNETVVAPQTVTLTDLVGHLDTYQNAYVKVENLTVSSVNGKNVNVSDGFKEYVVYCSYGNASLVTGDVFDVVGTIAHYDNGNVDQVKVWSADDIDVTSHATSPSITIAEVISASSGASVKTSGVVAQVNQKGFILTDGSDNIFVYQNAIPTVVVGQAVTVEGSRSAYNNVAQITPTTITPGATGQTVTRTALTTVSSSNATDYTTSQYVSLGGTLSISGSYYNVSIAGSSTQGSLYNLSGDEQFTAGAIDDLGGQSIIVIGYVTGSTNNYLSIAPVDVELAPVITKSDITNVSADGVTNATLSISFANNSGWTASVVPDYTIVTSASISGSTITYSVAPNTGGARTGSITVRLVKDSREVSAIISVSQLSGSTQKWNLVTELSGITAGTYAIAALNNNKYYTIPKTTISGQTFTCIEAAYSTEAGLTLPNGAG